MPKFYKLNDDFLFNTSADSEEAFLINMLDDSQDMYRLTDVSVVIIKLIKNEKPIHQIIHEISKMYHIERDIIEKDLNELIAELTQKNILREVN